MAQPLVALPMSVPAPEIHADLMAPRPDPRRDPGPESDPPTDHIIRSKVQPPVVRDSTIGRIRLLDWLNEHAADRVRVVAAEAGYGKTTLLAHWAGRLDTDVRWLKLDPTDADWSTFISYLVAAFREGDPTFGRATLRLLGHLATLGTTMEQALGQFLAELGRSIDRPTLLIIDDLQHVHGNADVRTIIGRLVERAPTSLTFLLSGRSRLDLRLGRQTAQGNVTSLGTDDLRFTRQEIEDLFTHGYRMALDGDLVSMVEARTEGWAASLQLLYSTLRNQSPSEIRDFIEALRGGHEPLYDFLAEEVLERQPHTMQQVLLHASILDRIAPELVVAALSATDEPLPLDTVVASLDLADELGLMSRNSMGSSRRRFHPLLQEFLQSHLVATTPKAQYRLIHLTVAKAAEGTHWPTAAHHFIEADAGEEAMRVIGDASITALGSGAWGTAMDLIARLADVPPSVRAQSIKARWLVAQGDAHEAIRHLEGIGSLGVLDPEDRAIYRLTMASALAHTDRLDALISTLIEILEDVETPNIIRMLALAWHGMIVWEDPHAAAAATLELAVRCEAESLPLYAGLARLNASTFFLALASYPRATAEASRAIALLDQADEDSGNAASAQMIIACSHFDRGDYTACRAAVRRAMGDSRAQPDVLAEAAPMLAWMGDLNGAEVALARGHGDLARRSLPVTMDEHLATARSLVLLAAGNFTESWRVAKSVGPTLHDPNNLGALAVARASSALLVLGDEAAASTVDNELEVLRTKQVRRWEPQLRFLQAIAHGEWSRARLAIASGDLSETGLLTVADVVGPHLGPLVPLPESVAKSVRSWPTRWRPVLRRTIESGSLESRDASAKLLAEIGEEEDIVRLIRWERSRKRGQRETGYAAELARRVSPTLCISDLGTVSVTIAGHEIRLAEVRRKAAALLLYLVSRPRNTATREQVLEALWPEQSFEQAGNSLHQTLYFLRRSLVRSVDQEKPTVEYVKLETELVYLESSLVHIDSVAFSRQAREMLSRHIESADALSLLRSYRGRFAPEFEYEDWAMAWREQVHGAFLELTEQVARSRLALGAGDIAAAVVRHALTVDPEAVELRPLLLACLYHSGAVAAASHLHRRYSLESMRDYGEALPDLAALAQAEMAKSRRDPKA